MLHFTGVRDRVVESLAGQPQREPARAWVPPPRSCYKVNWEACMDSATRVWTTGVLIRDYEGQVLATKCMHALSPPSGAHPKLYVCV